MFHTKVKQQLSNKEMQPGQTLFEYLKRKKHIALKQSLQTSFQKDLSKQKSFTRTSQLQKTKIQAQNKQPLQPASTKRRNKKSSSKKRRPSKSSESRKQNNSSLTNGNFNIFEQNNNKTTRRVSFDSQNQVNLVFKDQNPIKKTPNRSFLSMISPLKNKVNLSDLSNTKIPHKTHQQEQKATQPSNKVCQFYTKKKVKQAMSKVQKNFNAQIDFQKEIKQKLRNFFILLNSALVQLQQVSQSQISDGLDKKLKLIRSNMKLINSFSTNRQSGQSSELSEMIDQLYVAINQNFDSLEGQIKSQSQSGYQQKITKIKQDYEIKIQELTKQKTRLSRQINSTNKASQKMQKQYQKMLQKYNKLEQQAMRSMQEAQYLQQQNFASLQQSLIQLKVQNKSLRDKNNLFEKKCKDCQYRCEQSIRKIKKQHEEKINERQTFLLKQISLLKNQCSKDVKSLNQFHTNREDKLIIQVKNLQDTNSEQSLTIKKLSTALKQTQALIQSLQTAGLQQKNKAQNAVTDLYRMNEELYKHWLALKDVKTLLNRINMFDKFQRIYRDIPFEDFLFSA